MLQMSHQTGMADVYLKTDEHRIGYSIIVRELVGRPYILLMFSPSKLLTEA